MDSRYIMPSECPPGCPVDPIILASRLAWGDYKDFGLRLTSRVKLVPRLSTNSPSAGCLSSSYCGHTKTSLVFTAYLHRRMDNALILSEELEENAVQTLIPVALDDLFPEPCEKLRITNEDIRVRYRQGFTKRKDTVCQELAKEEHSLRRGLRDAVVEDVKKLFPYVDRSCRRRLNDNVLAH